MSGPRPPIAGLVVGLLGLAVPVWAQGGSAVGFAQSTRADAPAEFGADVRPGARIFVTDRNGVETEGRLLRRSPQELVLSVAGNEKLFSPEDVGRIEKRDSLWNGMLIGAIPSALVGGAAAGASCSPRCGRDVAFGMLLFGAVGAGIGALVDSGIHGYVILNGPALASPNARSVPSPVASLDQLWLRVRQGDRLNVVTLSGQDVAGKFVRVSNSHVTLLVEGGLRDIPSSNVRRITRTGNRYRSGALWGAATFGAIGLLASAGCSGGGCGNPLFVAMFVGSSGALWGAVVGAAIPKHPTVFESGSPSTVRVVPIVDPARAGVMISATF